MKLLCLDPPCPCCWRFCARLGYIGLSGDTKGFGFPKMRATFLGGLHGKNYSMFEFGNIRGPFLRRKVADLSLDEGSTRTIGAHSWRKVGC